MAGDIWEDISDNFLTHGDKTKAAAMESVKAAGSGKEIDYGKHALDVSRATIAGLHPALGVIDDVVTVGENINDAADSDSLGDRVGNGLKAANSALAAATGVGKAATFGPLAPIIGTSLAIGIPAAERMTDDKIRKEDAAEYRKHMDWFRHKENGTRNFARY